MRLYYKIVKGNIQPEPDVDPHNFGMNSDFIVGLSSTGSWYVIKDRTGMFKDSTFSSLSDMKEAINVLLINSGRSND